MKGLLLALAISAASALAFGTGNPADAMTVGAVTGMSDIAKPDTLTQKVWYRDYCWEFPWRCRPRHRYYRSYYYPRYYSYPRFYYYPWWRHHHRHHYYRHW
jgi:hypothetical protein